MIVSAYLRVILSGVRPRSCHRYARHCYAVRLRALARRSAQDDTGGRSRNPQGARLAGGSRAWSKYKLLDVTMYYCECANRAINQNLNDKLGFIEVLENCRNNPKKHNPVGANCVRPLVL